MLEQILGFINNLNPEVVIQAPSRINLINPLDAVEGDFWMPSVAINGINNPLSAFVYIKPREESSIIKSYSIYDKFGKFNIRIEREEQISKYKTKPKDELNGEFKLFYASVYRFIKTGSIFWEKFKKNNFELGILTTIPSQSGLGGSAAIIIAILYGFAKYFEMYYKHQCPTHCLQYTHKYSSTDRNTYPYPNPFKYANAFSGNFDHQRWGKFKVLRGWTLNWVHRRG